MHWETPDSKEQSFPFSEEQKLFFSLDHIHVLTTDDSK